jgi:putative membrane protein insertion efficiency factor
MVFEKVKPMIIKLLQSFIRGYQKLLSPIVGNQCRFYPTCSHYAHEALETHGAIKGLLLTIKRLLKCHPWVQCDWNDPVPPKELNKPSHKSESL